MFISGCGLFAKKKSFEDTDTFRELQKNKNEIDRKTDSIVKQNLMRSIDSLNRANDSLGKEIEKSMENIKKSQDEFNKKTQTK